MVLPSFLVIGAPKTGTTSLHRYLGAHPQVFMSQTKELNFFVAELNWPLGPEWYEMQFKGSEDFVASGEASPRYAQYPMHRGVPDRIARMIPDVKLIYLIRHPVERIRSQYVQAVQSWETRPADEAVLTHPPYLDTSRYAMQLDQYLRHFRREQILVVESEKLLECRRETLVTIFRFIGVDPDFDGTGLDREHKRAVDAMLPRALTPRLRRMPGYWRMIALLPESAK